MSHSWNVNPEINALVAASRTCNFYGWDSRVPEPIITRYGNLHKRHMRRAQLTTTFCAAHHDLKVCKVANICYFCHGMWLCLFIWQYGLLFLTSFCWWCWQWYTPLRGHTSILGLGNCLEKEESKTQKRMLRIQRLQDLKVVQSWESWATKQRSKSPAFRAICKW